MHRVLRVEAVRFDELGSVDPLLAARPEEPLLLTAEVPEVPPAGPPRDDRRPQLTQLVAELRLDQDQLRRDEQEQQDRRVPLEGEPNVLPQAVGNEIEVTWPGANALGLSALDEVFEAGETTADATGPLEPN